MRRILYNASDTETFQRIVKTAKNGIFGGTSATMDYLDKCRWFLERYDCIIIFTRDEGAHTCGWWKNPDYERCYHLSISFPGGWNRKKENASRAFIFFHRKIQMRVNAGSILTRRTAIIYAMIGSLKSKVYGRRNRISNYIAF